MVFGIATAMNVALPGRAAATDETPLGAAAPATPPASVEPLPQALQLAGPRHPPAARVFQAEPYSRQIVLADAAALLVGSMAAMKMEFAWPLLGVWLLPSPMVHLAHGNPRRALASLLIHATMPVVGAFVGLQFDGCRDLSFAEESHCNFQPMKVGIVLGILSATLIDAATLARMDVSSTPPPPPQPSLTWIPTLTVSRQADVGLAWRGLF
jgi:hypothetical protein